MKWIIKNWLILAAGLILTALAVRYAYHERGYIAVGSEWTVLPFMFLLRALCREIKEEAKRWLQNTRKSGRSWRRMDSGWMMKNTQRL